MPVIKFADLKVNQPVDGNATDAVLTVDVDPAKPMPLGSYILRLRVTDDSGNVSSPVEVQVTVVDEGKPVAVITGPTRIPFGKGFMLSGDKSSDAEGGKLTKFSWTLIQTP